MSAESRTTVFLVDDDASVRTGLGRLLQSAGYAVRAFASADEFLRADRTTPGPACLVLDVRMPGLSGQELQRQLRQADVVLPVVFVTGHGDIPMGVEAMKAGAVDFLTKPVSADQLINAVEQALARAERETRSRAAADWIHRRLETLTARERQVLDLVVRGRLNKQIAAELGIVEQTVKVHRARVMAKMEARSVADLVRAMEQVDRSEPPEPPVSANDPF